MANQPSLDISVAPLGALSTTSGTFQPSLYGASSAQAQAGTQIIGGSDAYMSTQASMKDGVCCMDDRLDGWLRLAGGALLPALMKNFVHDGELLSGDLRWLKEHGFYLLLHEDCGALAKLLTILARLQNPEAAGYRLLEADGVYADAGDRRAVAAWAATVTPDYADVDAAKEMVHEVQPVVGQHVAGYVSLIDRPGVTLDAAKKIEDASSLKTLVVTLWVADEIAAYLTDDETLRRRAALLARVFSAETVLVLGGPEMVAALVKR